MKTTKLITIAPLALALTTGIAFAQGNPHLDTTDATQQQASIQGNPHLGWELKQQYAERFQGNPHQGFEAAEPRILARYQGNPHEGEEFKVVRLASQANPHIGFEIVPLALATR